MLGCDFSLWAGITMAAYLVCPISNFKMLFFCLSNIGRHVVQTQADSAVLAIIGIQYRFQIHTSHNYLHILYYITLIIVFALAGLTRKLLLYGISSFKALRIRKCITGCLLIKCSLNRWSG